MKLRSFITLLALGFFAVANLTAQEAAPKPSAAAQDMQAFMEPLMAKLKSGKQSAETLAPELAQLDSLLAKYSADKSDDVAQFAMLKAQIQLSVLRNEEAGKQALEVVKRDFAGTKTAATAERMLYGMTPEGKAEAAAKAAAEKAKLAALVGKPAPELNFTWSNDNSLTTLSALKGKVVVLDFWATWCGPCIGSFPQVREHVEHFKGLPVEFIGVTSLQGRVVNLEPKAIDTKNDPQREYALMHDFMKAKEMTWKVGFTQQEVFNPDYAIRGIPYVAIIAPDGTVRHAGLHPGNKTHDISGKITEILKEFNLETPKA